MSLSPHYRSTYVANATSHILALALAVLVCWLVVARLVQQSMTIDGVLYAAISRNLAEGVGSLWNPQFSGSLFDTFAEHLPMMLWFQGVAFWLFGDSMAVERGFSFACLLLNGAVILGIWRELTRGAPYQKLGMVALLFTLVSGKIGYGFSNGLMENFQMIFSSLAVLCILVAYRPSGFRNHSRTLWVICGGLAISLAVLSKSPVGLFPLAVPAFHWFFFRTPRFGEVVIDTLILSLVVGLFFVILLAFEGPRLNVLQYVHNQFVASLTGARGGAGIWKAIEVL